MLSKVLAISLVLFCILGFAATPQKIMCEYNAGSYKLYRYSNMPYALCSKALCTLMGNKALCSCGVYKGASVGPKNYEQSKPSFSNKKLTNVTSNFSTANTVYLVQTRCSFPEKTAWADCFGVKCTVNYKDGKPVASCLCPITKTKSFVSVGPTTARQCKTAANKIWSAATAAQGVNNVAVLSNAK